MALTSYYAQMLVAMQARINGLVPQIKYIDLDLHQLDDYEGDRPPVAFPCLLVDFTSTRFNQLGNDVEEGDATISCRIGFAPFSPSNSLAPGDVKEKGLNFFEIENNVYKALKGWAPWADESETELLCQPLNRVADGTENRNDKLRVRVIMFNTAFQDDGATVPLTPANPDLSLEL